MEQSNKHFIMGFMLALTSNKKYMELPDYSHKGVMEFQAGMVSGLIVWILSLSMIFILASKILLALSVR